MILIRRIICSTALTLLAAGCGASGEGSDGGLLVIKDMRVDKTFPDAGADQIAAFGDGNSKFDQLYYPGDGLGPLFADVSCGACHESGLRGPGVGKRMVVVDADGITTAVDQSELPYGNVVRAQMCAGATLALTPPDAGNVLVTTRVPPPILGRGYIEAIDDSEIERVAAEQSQRSDGIHGQVNRIAYASETTADPAFNPYTKGQLVIGRFGLKARVATLDDFAADAFLNDMGITTPMRPVEPPNPNGLTDDKLPGIDAPLDTVNKLAVYMRLSDIPTRPTPPEGAEALFAQVGCAVCHVPSLKTRADYPIAQLAGVDAPVYTDLLLHEMGDALADGMAEGAATSRQFKTPPLIGVHYLKAFLNDGRAHSVGDAIAQHGGEGTAAAQAFAALPAADQQTLINFVDGL